MLYFSSTWFIHLVRNHSEMCETPLKTCRYKVGSAKAGKAGVVNTKMRTHSMIPAEKPEKAAGNFLEGRAV